MYSMVLVSSVILWHEAAPLSFCAVPVLPFAVHSGAQTESEWCLPAEII